MAKNIILLSDGTGNSASSAHKTNIWRIYQALDLTADDQIAIYDAGVGTSSFRPIALLGQALGVGLAENVKELYRFLSRNYEQDDRIYAFGFSRGAFTIRTFVWLVSSQGLVERTLEETAFQREVNRRYASFREAFSCGVRRRIPTAPSSDSPVHGPEIEFVGLWDTVDAYGVPIDELKELIDYLIFPLTFPDRRLSKSVKCAYHALALDDERHTFHPVLWDESGEVANGAGAGRVSQVWFPGVHANVGGGYPMDGLAYVSLEWILSEAQARKLRFHQTHLDEIRRQIAVFDDLYDSRAGAGMFYRYAPRDIMALCQDERAGVTINLPKIHESVFRRLRKHNVAYAPITLPRDYAVVRADGTITTRQTSAPADFPETDIQAEARVCRMHAVWDLVWLRKIVYYATVGLTFGIVALPWIVGASERGAKSPPRCLIADLSTHLSDYVPQRWLDAVCAQPLLAFSLVAMLVSTLLANAWLRRTIRARSDFIWRLAPNQSSPSAWAVNPEKRLIYRVRTQKHLVRAAALVRREFPALVVVVLLGALYAFLS